MGNEREDAGKTPEQLRKEKEEERNNAKASMPAKDMTGDYFE